MFRPLESFSILECILYLLTVWKRGSLQYVLTFQLTQLVRYYLLDFCKDNDIESYAEYFDMFNKNIRSCK